MDNVRKSALIISFKHWVNNLPLRMKLILPTWLLMTFGLISGGVVIIHVVGENLESSLLSRAEVLANGATSHLVTAIAYETNTAIIRGLADYSHDPDVVAAILTRSDGKKFKKIKRLPSNCISATNSIRCESDSLIRIVRSVELRDDFLGQFELYVSLEGIQKEHRRLIGLLIIGTVFFSLLAWVFALLIHSFVTKPLSSLHQSMSNIISRSSDCEPLPIKHNDELGQLTACFNNMVASLAERDKQLNITLSKLKEKSRYIYQVLDAVDHGVVVIAPGDSITYFNPIAEKMLAMLGCEPNNLIQIMDVLEPTVLVNQLSIAIDAHIGLSGVEIFHRQTGKMYRVRTVPIATERHSLVQFEDITLNHIAEHRRMLAELIFDKNQNSLLVLSRKLDVEAQNTVCARTFGSLRAWSDISFNEDFVFTYSQVKTLLLTGNYQWTIELISAKKTLLPCCLTAQTVANKKGKVEAFIVSIVDQTASLELKRLHHIALHDLLTGLPNRAHALDRLARDHETGYNMHVLFIDLDGFKAVNDEFGHHIGDELLKVVARRLMSNISCSDFVARLAGDEFLLALKNSHDPVVIVERLLAKLNETIHINGFMPKISASIGIRRWDASDDSSLEMVIEEADRAMYMAKASGKNGYMLNEIIELEWVL